MASLYGVKITWFGLLLLLAAGQLDILPLFFCLGDVTGESKRERERKREREKERER